jgi:hypothetical protein
LDIKPYIPYADAIPEALSDFAKDGPQRVAVTWGCVAPPEEVRVIVEQSLSLQPQPAYHEDTARAYATEIAGWRVQWVMGEAGARVESCEIAG